LKNEEELIQFEGFGRRQNIPLKNEKMTWPY
jgi:hypothetical protein